MNASPARSPASRPRLLPMTGQRQPLRVDQLSLLPDPAELPTRTLHIAALRGLGYSLRTIGRHYRVSPQAISVMLTRHKTALRRAKPTDGMQQLSPRAINVLGRLGIRNLSDARGVTNWKERLRGLRNCGSKTEAEIQAWASGGSAV